MGGSVQFYHGLGRIFQPEEEGKWRTKMSSKILLGMLLLMVGSTAFAGTTNPPCQFATSDNDFCVYGFLYDTTQGTPPTVAIGSWPVLLCYSWDTTCQSPVQT